MEDFTCKPAASFSEMQNTTNMELLNNLSDQLSQPMISPLVLDYLSNDAFFSHANPADQAPQSSSVQVPQQSLFTSFGQTIAGDFCIQRQENGVTPSSETPSSPGLGSESGGNYRPDIHGGTGGRKRKRKNEGQGEKPKEVIHVRAKRGQATDSHSLAERVRRERINEKLKVLQDLVPGCYKTMGMAVMLDVIISYVRSLQNQIEFLSMKLSAASMFYDFNSPEAEAIETLQRTASSYDAQETERLAREGQGGTLPRFHSTWPL